MSPVIPPGTVAIGAIGRVQRLPRYASTLPGYSKRGGGEGSSNGSSALDNTLVPASILPVSWSADHRVVDGATMARFSNEWKGYVEEPDSMLAFLR
jgi:2-oxoisovalerate dehydrogenase E2 component (dihydrolipoyl transacylase)